jgi:excinuclease ABC subunit C
MVPTPPDLAAQIGQLPHRPGVYLFRDRFHRIIYVGKARDLHRRVSQYFHPSRRFNADAKTRALVQSVSELEVHPVNSEPEALLLEGRLIKEYRPKYNVAFRDDKRFLLVKLNMEEVYPRFQLTRTKKEDGCRYFGPFVYSSALKSTLSVMRKTFGLRSCRPPVPTERDYKHCLDHIIQNCSAPCIAKISREAYLARVREAAEFLEGATRRMQGDLEAEMLKAAEALEFEKAAELRNLIEALRLTANPVRKFTRDLPSTVIPERDMEELGRVLKLPSVPRHIECFDISNISTLHKVASVVVFRNGRPDRYSYRRYRIKTVEGQDDFACMREAVFRRYRRMLGLVEDAASGGLSEGQKPGVLPDLVVVDGGAGQLGAALGALSALPGADIPVIGLAKRDEEIYAPGCHEPLRLPRESSALRLLQRVRDEAHRVANGYHQLLLQRRVSASLLDECPGVSAQRKAALLRAFGSVKRLRLASVEEIAAVPGIGPKLAGQIAGFLSGQTTGAPPT